MRPVWWALNSGSRPPCRRLWTSAVMNTVLPARDRPVTPKRIEGWMRPAARSAMLSRAIRASSVKLVSDRATIDPALSWKARRQPDIGGQGGGKKRDGELRCEAARQRRHGGNGCSPASQRRRGHQMVVTSTTMTEETTSPLPTHRRPRPCAEDLMSRRRTNALAAERRSGNDRWRRGMLLAGIARAGPPDLLVGVPLDPHLYRSSDGHDLITPAAETRRSSPWRSRRRRGCRRGRAPRGPRSGSRGAAYRLPCRAPRAAGPRRCPPSSGCGRRA